MLDKGNLINYWPSGGIDQQGILLHLVQTLCVDEVLGLLIQVAMQTDNLQAEYTSQFIGFQTWRHKLSVGEDIGLRVVLCHLLS